jgi:hypothetical protein
MRRLKIKIAIANGSVVVDGDDPSHQIVNTHIGKLPFEAKIRIGNILKEISNTNETFINYIEDLVILLVKKKIIMRDELPAAVIEKAIQRKALRKELAELQKIV